MKSLIYGLFCFVMGFIFLGHFVSYLGSYEECHFLVHDLPSLLFCFVICILMNMVFFFSLSLVFSSIHPATTEFLAYQMFVIAEDVFSCTVFTKYIKLQALGFFRFFCPLQYISLDLIIMLKYIHPT